jgi:hypothetical protein
MFGTTTFAPDKNLSNDTGDCGPQTAGLQIKLMPIAVEKIAVYSSLSFAMDAKESHI